MAATGPWWPVLVSPLAGQLVDVADEGLLGDHVRVVVVALVDVGIERLRVAHEVARRPRRASTNRAVAVEPARELLQHLGVVVRAHAGVDAVVPAVQAAQQVVARRRGRRPAARPRCRHRP